MKHKKRDYLFVQSFVVHRRYDGDRVTADRAGSSAGEGGRWNEQRFQHIPEKSPGRES